MVPWRVARSLLKLRDQWKAAHPGAANPGFIGDAAHASRESDHNPWVDDPDGRENVVTAGDFYHQPKLGADAGKLAEALKAAKDPRVKYVIWNRRIWSLARDSEGWRPYKGSNPHTGHCHVSVSSTKSRYDSVAAWTITTKATGPSGNPPEPTEGITMSEATQILEQLAKDQALASKRWKQTQDALNAHDQQEDARYGEIHHVRETVDKLAEQMAALGATVGQLAEAVLTPKAAANGDR